MELPKELIISDALKKVLQDSDSEIAKKILSIEDVHQCPQWINCLDIAKDDASKISYVDKTRYKAYNDKKLNVEDIKVGDEVEICDGTPYYGSSYGLTYVWGHKGVITYKSFDGSEFNVKINGDTWSVRPYDIKGLYNNVWNSKVRYFATCGKVVNKLLGPQDGKELAKFCELFQAFHPDFRFNVDFDLNFVKGDDILYWYNEDRYLNLSGSLGSSCMRYNRCKEWLKFYAKNDDLIQLFIVTDKQSKKLVGRSLIWNNEYFDRAYANSTTLETKIITYLQSLGLKDAYLAYNNDETITFDVKYGYKDFDYFPYCDSFRYLGYNQISTSGEIDYIIELDNAEGNNDDDAIFCDICGDRIYEDENAVWLEYRDVWVHQDYATRTHNGEYYLEDDCVYSEWMDEYIYEEEAIETYNGGWTLDTRAIEMHDGSYADKNDDDVVKAYDGEYYLKDDCEFSEKNDYYIPIDEAHYDEELKDWILKTEIDVEA